MKTLNKAEKELADFEAVFWALSHSSRRHVLVVLNARGGKMSAGDIAQRFSCSWPTTTRHLRVLQRAHLVKVSREGREKIYELNRSRFEIIENWLKWFKNKETNK